LLYGDASIDQWLVAAGGSSAEPWASFARAASLWSDDRRDEAVSVWREIAANDDIESRHVLQAWHFIRAAGVSPPADSAADVLGVIAEVAVGEGCDLLAAYLDGSVRYLGGATLVAAPDVVRLAEALTAWLVVGQLLAPNIVAWDHPALPSLPSGHSRVLMLTPAGPRFGQGPDAELRQMPAAGGFLDVATTLLQVVTYLPGPQTDLGGVLGG
jgi:hypothetical protein